MTEDPFDSRPDPALGHLLREHLAAADDGAFAARMRALVAGTRQSSWDVLSAWAAPGLAVAAMLLLALGLVLGRAAAPATGFEQALEPTSLPVELVTSARPNPDRVLGAAMEEP